MRLTNEVILTIIVIVAIIVLFILNLVFPLFTTKTNLPSSTSGKTSVSSPAIEKLILSDAEWRRRLTPEQYQVLRKGKTEPAFSGEYYNNKKPGTYLCTACSLPVFSSTDQYDAKTGWPSFTQPIRPENVTLRNALSLFKKVTDVLCARCESHLGHLLSDGPPPEKKHYSINSIAIQFVPTPEKTGEVHGTVSK